jgi:hypothetical protein
LPLQVPPVSLAQMLSSRPVLTAKARVVKAGPGRGRRVRNMLCSRERRLIPIRFSPSQDALSPGYDSEFSFAA